MKPFIWLGAALWAAAFVRAGLSGVIIGDESIVIRNPIRTHKFPLERVRSFRLGTTGDSLFYSAVVVLDDGSELPAWGIQPPNRLTRPDDRSAELMVNGIKMELRERKRLRHD